LANLNPSVIRIMNTYRVCFNQNQIIDAPHRSFPRGGGRLICCFILFLCVWTADVNSQQGYQVKAGDTLFISVFGHTDMSGAVSVGPDGNISLPPPAGIFQVKGLTVDEITILITERLKEYIRNPKVSIAIREFVGFIVHVYGQVSAPGFYRIPDDTSLQEVFAYAGGLTTYADLGQIRILQRNDEGKQTNSQVNFKQFLKANDLSANPIVGENSAVFVPRLDEESYRKQHVVILGSVQAPGVFPLDSPRSLMDVLALANGVSPDAMLNQVQIFHNSEMTDVNTTVDLEAYLERRSSAGNPLIEPGQTIFVPGGKLPKERTYLVNVIGQVMKPGAYPVIESSRLLEAINLAGGFAEQAQINRVKLIPRSDMNRPTTEIDVGAYLSGSDLQANPPLFEGDTVLVPLSDDSIVVSSLQQAFLKSMSINVIGEVVKPATYELKATATVLDVLTLAGGPKPNADLKRVAILRSSSISSQPLQVDLSKTFTEGIFNTLPPLQPNDTIFIPQQKPGFWGQFARAAYNVSSITAAVIILANRL
jgi:protein involved in polysaccharide export with SLBB domain